MSKRKVDEDEEADHVEDDTYGYLRVTQGLKSAYVRVRVGRALNNFQTSSSGALDWRVCISDGEPIVTCDWVPFKRQRIACLSCEYVDDWPATAVSHHVHGVPGEFMFVVDNVKNVYGCISMSPRAWATCIVAPLVHALKPHSLDVYDTVVAHMPRTQVHSLEVFLTGELDVLKLDQRTFPATRHVLLNSNRTCEQTHVHVHGPWPRIALNMSPKSGARMHLDAVTRRNTRYYIEDVPSALYKDLMGIRAVELVNAHKGDAQFVSSAKSLRTLSIRANSMCRKPNFALPPHLESLTLDADVRITRLTRTAYVIPPTLRRVCITSEHVQHVFHAYTWEYVRVFIKQVYASRARTLNNNTWMALRMNYEAWYHVLPLSLPRTHLRMGLLSMWRFGNGYQAHVLRRLRVYQLCLSISMEEYNDVDDVDTLHHVLRCTRVARIAIQSTQLQQVLWQKHRRSVARASAYMQHRRQ